MDYEIISIHLGHKNIGNLRKAALEKMAAEAGHYWNGQPSIGKWLVDLADKKIKGEWKQIEAIVRRIMENGLASTHEQLEVQFEYFAREAGWSDEEIKAAIESPWFPRIK